ncbi:MAG TPA: DEAD/DEAH box helicase [Dokdonella sp.]|uniref:DEAD/DEAH box helicase n=1 Tax=Dokdonella sp. TaxID=2291710 RepID=UPI002D802EB4|nr:DEAD/DEAH box helicase [Dokdonella sp.]HET9033653.1 DEAD/DEAH box helicase [Dokdonella sp.]
MSHSQPLTDTVFESFDLHPSLLAGLNDTGFIRCTPIQALTLPIALNGSDIAGQAQTGTGKTAAFLVAVLNRLLTKPALNERKSGDPRAVILAPTRELAIQIEKDFRSIGRHTGLTSALVYGGVDYDKQREMLKNGVDIVIATPGRIIDYLKQNVVSFRAVDVCVLDEADRMFDLGFIKDIRFLMRRMPPPAQRQGMLFSATLSHRVLELAYDHMNSPEKVTAETETVTADRVRQVVYFPATEEKIPLLLNLLGKLDENRSIIFINTKAMAERLTRALERNGHRVATLSGDVPQAKRERLLARFQKGDIELLVATDVAARGLHIPAVSHVFNFDLPQDAEDYVHRIGRTARLGAEGDAISFACDRYAMALPDIEAYIEQKIPTARVEPELLVVPPPRVRAKREISKEDAEANAADDLRNTAGAPPKEEKPRRSGERASASRDGKRSRGPRKEYGANSSARPGPRRAQAETVANVVPAADSAASTTSADPAKKRRRRGGRGRKRGDAVEQKTTTTDTSVGNVQTEGGRSERKPRRERAPRHEKPMTGPASEPAAAAPTHKKQGFFNRVASFFGRH